MGVLFILSALFAVTFNNIKINSLPNRANTFVQRYLTQDHFFLPSFKKPLLPHKITPSLKSNYDIHPFNQLMNSLIKRQTSFVGLFMNNYEEDNKKQSSRQLFNQSEYELQDHRVSEIVRQLFDKNNPKTIQHALPVLMECDKILEKHPELKQLIETQRFNPNMISFINEIKTIENLPPKTAQTKVELQKNLNEMNKKDKLIFAYRISQKFK